MAKREPKHKFPDRPKCPRCKARNTLRYASRGPVQYRVCQTPVCRHRFKVAALKPSRKKKAK